MNSLYTSGVRQTNSIQADLERLRNGDHSASLLGQISASLAALSRTIEDYDSMAKRELIKAKQEKAQMRVQKFRQDYTEFRSQFDSLKANAAAEVGAFVYATSRIGIFSQFESGSYKGLLVASCSAENGASWHCTARITIRHTPPIPNNIFTVFVTSWASSPTG
ncbi:hypothetical protein AX16_010618 [Volvariella volvacea WC 439]|nr:hypothetical protein AX16_010618 [Volvariella volvacea WC 439]